VNFAGLLTTPQVFKSVTYVVTRRGPTGVDGDGRALLSAPSTLSISASVQPLSGRDLQRLPEGMRAAERLKLYTTTPLAAIGAPDVVTIDGDDYEVEHVERWTGFGAGADYYKIVARKVGN
jgi:hypothetical protein